LVVLFGLGMVFLSSRLQLPWLIKADSVAALVVAGIVIWISLKLGKQTIDDLLDSVPSGLVEQITQKAQVPGVGEVKRVRLRRSGPTFFADVTLSVRADFPLAYAHQIADQAEQEVRTLLPEADIVVHVDPLGQDHENTVSRIREIAAQNDFSAHAIAVSSKEGVGSMEMHLEVDGELSVRDAHERVSEFEKKVHQALPSFSMITTHIEPSSMDVSVEGSPEPSDEKKVQRKLKQISEQSELPFSVHDLHMWKEEGKLVVVFHCDIDGQTNVARAHALTAEIEGRLRKEVPYLGRVLIHIEPQESALETS
jgi:divalent metal cation (Fe/Co/Zn/Cd) transporter